MSSHPTRVDGIVYIIGLIPLAAFTTRFQESMDTLPFLGIIVGWLVLLRVIGSMIRNGISKLRSSSTPR